MMLTQLGSLNALEQDNGNNFWKKWLGTALPSADSVGRVYSQIHLESIRGFIHHVYSRLKRNKAIKKTYGFNTLILDGHEHTSSYRRSCDDCLERIIHFKNKDCIQYYHRNVIAMLSGQDFPILLDVEEQKPGEDEVACATRLIKRLLANYPRAFDLVIADGLYLKANFFNLLLDHGKEVIVVLKDETRDLMKDAMGIFEHESPVIETLSNMERQMWDVEHFTSWETLGSEVRVVRSVETVTVRRQLTGEKESVTSEWMWATTISQDKARTKAIVALGHSRWLVENKAINEMVTYWYADHVYKHHTNAIAGFWLTLLLVINLFRAFVCLNIKPVLRDKHSNLYFARLIFSALHESELVKIPP